MNYRRLLSCRLSHRPLHRTLHRILRAVALTTMLMVAQLMPASMDEAQAIPTGTFGIEIGSALLCLDQLNSKYFYDYLFLAFGMPYKTEGGAYWFSASRNRRSGTDLWGVQLSDVLVNDSSSPAEFIAAVFNGTPQQLADAIERATGFHFTSENPNDPYALRQTHTGSVIAFAGTRAKIYCAKSKYLVPSLP